MSSSLSKVMKAMAPKFVYMDADDESYFKGETKPFLHCKTYVVANQTSVLVERYT